MHSFTTLTLATAFFSALTAAVPLASHNKHQHFHPQLHAAAVAPAGLDPITTVNLVTGECGGSSGFTCGSGYCCSVWGYCGTTPEYCGDGSASENSTDTSEAGRPGYPVGPPGGWPASSPSGGSWGQPGTSAAPATSSAAPAPSSAAPAPSSEAPVSSSAAPAPSSYAPAPSSATPVPSSAAPAPSSASAPAAPSSAPAAPSSAAPTPSSYAPAPSAPSAAPSAAPSSPSSGGGFSGYKMYNGNGSPSAGWPSMDQWMDFESAWSASLPNLQASCAQFSVPNNTPEEISEMKAAITSAASSYGVDSRFILAVMMQESNGCVRVHTTNNGVVNPGLFQSHNGKGSCNRDAILDPCPQSQIQQMVDDGVNGTQYGDGLKQTMALAGSTGCQAYYGAAVIYNSGNLPANLDDNTATPCYASDVANRLMGWTQGASSCTL